MNTSQALVAGDPGAYEEPMQEQARNPLMVLHLLLQGRYWLALLLAIVLGAAGAVLGYALPHKTFSSTGMIQIKPVIRPIIGGADAGGMPMFESFVSSQIILLRSQRVVDLAIEQATQSKAWQDAGRSYSAGQTDEFLKNLLIERQGEIVQLTFTDRTDEVAVEAVMSLLDAYYKLYMEDDQNSNRKERQSVTQLRDEYMNKLKSFESQIDVITDNMGADAIEARYQSLIMQANAAEMQYQKAKDMLSDWQAMHGTEATAAQPTTGPAASQKAPAVAQTPPAASQKAPVAKTYSAQEIAEVNMTMRDMMGEMQNLKQQLNQYNTVADNHPVRRRLLDQRDRLQGEIDKFAANWKPPIVSNGGTNMATAPDMAEALRAQEELYGRRYEEAKGEVLKLGLKIGQIKALRMDMEMVRAYVDSAKQRLEQMNVESNSSGRISIISSGDRPVAHDKRIPIAAASSFGGAVAGVGIVLLIGLMDRRLRTIDQARMSLKQGMRVLGMLPSLPRNLEDPGAASFAALCVHHIRMLLQVMPRMDSHPVIAVTSPSPGDGKTSLTLALALSFAASGKSTLLIDCDIVGAGLTRRVNAIIRRRIGQILIRENLITPAQLREALNLAQRTGRKLGEVLVDEGYVEQQQVTHALAMQAETSVGLLDVMRGEVLEECVADTGMARLWILPVGSALAEHGATISPEGFRAVLEQARKRFDVVLVDTGPVPGSIESSVAASQSDGVVLCVSRGEQGPLVRRASEHLHDIGSRALGLVFNRATPEDFSSSYGAMSSPSIPARIPEKQGTDRATFGPVASAVAGTQVKKN